MGILLKSACRPERRRRSGLVAPTAPEYAEAMKREDVIRDILGLELELAALEDQYLPGWIQDMKETADGIKEEL